ncbi:MAG: hypothetical protein LBC59_00770 [Chitinispirillales bacterium]|jgi:hypothetical protein|nr:hypothetical protein [Chitinispirillales bacterium]
MSTKFFTPRVRPLFVASLLSVVAFSLFGCGGGKDASSSSVPAPTPDPPVKWYCLLRWSQL